MKNSEQGSLLVGTLIIGIFMLSLGIVVGNAAIAQLARTTRNVGALNALQVTEAGVEKTISRLNTDDTFAGFTEGEVFFNNEQQGLGVFQTEVMPGGDDEKIIFSTGAVYKYNDTEGEPINQRRLRITVVGTGSEGFSVHTGPGGLKLGGSANITNSDVFVNGFIELKGASRIGTNSEPLQVSVANLRCPLGNNPGSTYPELCSAGQEPIDMAYSTKIYGTVCATHQTSSGPNNNIQGGDGGQGLVPGCEAPGVQPPEYDRQAHIDTVSVTAAGNDNTYVCQSWPFDRTWPENIRLNGNVNIGGSCNISLEGNAYITGDLRIGGASTIRVSDSLGQDMPVIVVDGEIDVGGSGQVVTNSQGTGVKFISFQSESSCSPACTELSGNELKNSQEKVTVDVGGGVNLAGVVFQSYWGTAKLRGSGSVGGIAGQTVDMSGAGTVVFGTNLSSGEKTWRATSYQEVGITD